MFGFLGKAKGPSLLSDDQCKLLSARARIRDIRESLLRSQVAFRPGTNQTTFFFVLATSFIWTADITCRLGDDPARPAGPGVRGRLLGDASEPRGLPLANWKEVSYRVLINAL